MRPPYKFTLPRSSRRLYICRQVSGFLALHSNEQRLFLMALVLLPATVVGLRLFGFKRWYAWLHWLGQRSCPSQTLATTTHAIHRTLLLLRLVMRYAPHRGNCLSQSLTLWWLLQQQGIASDLRIGVRQEKEVLQAHAWIEYKGQPLNDSSDVRTRYAVFDKVLLPMSAKFL